MERGGEESLALEIKGVVDHARFKDLDFRLDACFPENPG